MVSRQGMKTPLARVKFGPETTVEQNQLGKARDLCGKTKTEPRPSLGDGNNNLTVLTEIVWKVVNHDRQVADRFILPHITKVCALAADQRKPRTPGGVLYRKSVKIMQ